MCDNIQNNLDSNAKKDQNLESENLEPQNLESMEKTFQEKLEKQLKEEKEKFLIIIADYENKIKRIQKDAMHSTNMTVSNIVKNITPIIDDLNSAVSFLENEQKESIELIVKNMKKVLIQNGIKEIIPNEKEIFNPKIHQAVTCQDSEFEEGTIIKVLKTGYQFHDQIITPALVITSK